MLAKHVMQRVLTAWHDVYMHAVMKRFQTARAHGLHQQHVELRVMHLWQAHCREQQRMGALQSKAEALARQKLQSSAISSDGAC